MKNLKVLDILDNINILNEIDFDQSLKDQEMIEDVDIGWERNDAVPICTPFTGNPGLNVELLQNPEPIDILNLLFKPEMWERLTTQTNLYAKNRICRWTIERKTSTSNQWGTERYAMFLLQTDRASNVNRLHFTVHSVMCHFVSPWLFEQYHTKKHYQAQIELENSGQSSDDNSEWLTWAYTYLCLPGCIFTCINMEGNCDETFIVCIVYVYTL